MPYVREREEKVKYGCIWSRVQYPNLFRSNLVLNLTRLQTLFGIKVKDRLHTGVVWWLNLSDINWVPILVYHNENSNECRLEMIINIVHIPRDFGRACIEYITMSPTLISKIRSQENNVLYLTIIALTLVVGQILYI